MEQLYGSEVIFSVRTALLPSGRELRLYALCRCGAGAWLARLAPFEELFFDDQLVRGLTVRQALERLERRYPGCRRLPPAGDADWLRRRSASPMLGRFAAHLEACDPARDLRRAYAIEAGVGLFGAGLVAVAFGRIGRPGRRLVYVLATEAEACRAVRARLRRRASAPRRLGVAYELRRLTDPDGWG